MIKSFLSYRKKALSYFKNHIEFNALVHVLGGIGLGILIAPFTIPHPVRWSLVLLALSISGHMYTLFQKK